ncbi:DUF2085 domain-containing protein [Geothrix sp. PMB-07]|uniref:DUF2085 domain-containing protein n=1 Tax=Geothrix sp. PMB-07 TaxID=3068640 RepID=UPI00274206CB|nr:DUF2085 domain-containing protein [Geothrix sp. PMB-07]WLT32227.1 DUF2085 domain-containing protein [Geothrix sp. PMB-07]
MTWTRPRWVLAFRILLGGIGLLPWIMAGHRSVLLEAVFGTTCHRLAERSLLLGGVQMLVCSRCAGIYLGLLTGALLPAGAWAVRHARTLALGAALPMALDVLTQDLGWHPSWHPARLATGWWLGLGLMVLAVAHLRDWAEVNAPNEKQA